MRTTLATALTLGLLCSVFAGGTAAGYGGHGGGSGGHASVGGGHHGGGFHGGGRGGWGGHGWGGHGWGGHGGYGGYGWGLYGYPFYGWPDAYGYDDPYGDDYSDGAYPNGDDQSGPAAGPQQQLWYYCDAPKGYYPYVSNCSHNWRPVAPTPPPQPPGG